MLKARRAGAEDVDVIFKWANDPSARANSYDHAPIDYESHSIWFRNRLNSDRCFFYLFSDENDALIGQVRIELIETNSAVISVSVDNREREKGYSSEMLKMATQEFLVAHNDIKILAYIFHTNDRSFRSFLKAGFSKIRDEIINGIPSHVLLKAQYD